MITLSKEKTIKRLEERITSYEIIAGGDKTNTSKRLVYLAKANETKSILIEFLKKCQEKEEKEEKNNG